MCRSMSPQQVSVVQIVCVRPIATRMGRRKSQGVEVLLSAHSARKGGVCLETREARLNQTASNSNGMTGLEVKLAI